MLDFHERRKLKGYLYSKYAVVVLFAFALLFSISVYGRYEAERKVAAKRDEAAKELDALKQRAATLEAEVSRLNSDRGVEEEIRDRYEVAKKGEQVVVIVGEEGGDTEATTTPEASPARPEAKRSFWNFLW